MKILTHTHTHAHTLTHFSHIFLLTQQRGTAWYADVETMVFPYSGKIMLPSTMPPSVAAIRDRLTDFVGKLFFLVQ